MGLDEKYGALATTEFFQQARSSGAWGIRLAALQETPDITTSQELNHFHLLVLVLNGFKGAFRPRIGVQLLYK